jgi:hypothetical protein
MKTYEVIHDGKRFTVQGYLHREKDEYFVIDSREFSQVTDNEILAVIPSNAFVIEKQSVDEWYKYKTCDDVAEEKLIVNTHKTIMDSYNRFAKAINDMAVTCDDLTKSKRPDWIKEALNDFHAYINRPYWLLSDKEQKERKNRDYWKREVKIKWVDQLFDKL